MTSKDLIQGLREYAAMQENIYDDTFTALLANAADALERKKNEQLQEIKDAYMGDSAAQEWLAYTETAIPCPFCGKVPTMIRESPKEDCGWELFHTCDSENSMVIWIGGATKIDVIVKWNTRVSVDEIELPEK